MEVWRAATCVLLLAAGGLCAPCTVTECQLPDCHCSGTIVPGNLNPANVPQIVLVTLTDAIRQDLDFDYYSKLFNPNKTNPNGCPPTFTVFVSHPYTNYYEVQTMHSLRHEIADNSITRRGPSSWWAEANSTEWENEVGGMREILAKWAQIPAENVKGFRAPYLQNGGDTEFEVLAATLKLTYDTTRPTRMFMRPPMWPYTLDYDTIQECAIPPCPTASYPGFWEVPIIDLQDENGNPCNELAACAKPESEEAAYLLLKSNFDQHYNSNRAPFHVPLTAAWFETSPDTNFEATRRFFNDIMDMDHVWLVTISQAIEWVRNPTQNDELNEFEPWKCDGEPPAVCDQSAVNTCRYGDDTLITCTTPCPPNYPGYGNPDGN
ncbi:chitin deacetylase 8-like [Branchiostoma floridae]|uniref:Chitin deacetylase 8-like n=2 Tax=Branchiostoma floridae TaxID=7739 RepID=A0A9J7L2Y4_BRAFL|nr:chitin deacetylase 8-like [Branchiostoma floridae]